MGAAAAPKACTIATLAGDCCTGVLKHDDERSKFGEMPWAMASGWLSAGEMADYLS